MPLYGLWRAYEDFVELNWLFVRDKKSRYSGLPLFRAEKIHFKTHAKLFAAFERDCKLGSGILLQRLTRDSFQFGFGNEENNSAVLPLEVGFHAGSSHFIDKCLAAGKPRRRFKYALSPQLFKFLSEHTDAD